jgi:hypothetical protein
MNLTRRNSVPKLHTVVIELILVGDAFLDSRQREFLRRFVLLNIQEVLFLIPAWISAISK